MAMVDEDEEVCRDSITEDYVIRSLFLYTTLLWNFARFTNNA